MEFVIDGPLLEVIQAELLRPGSVVNGSVIGNVTASAEFSGTTLKFVGPPIAQTTS